MTKCVLKMRLAAGGLCALLMGCMSVAQSVSFQVMDGNSTCVKGELEATFNIAYTTTTNRTALAGISLPSSSTSSGFCGASDLLQLHFGANHSLSMSFSRDEQVYELNQLSLQFNLSDVISFPQSSSTGLLTVVANVSGILASVNSSYVCLSSVLLELSDVVNVTFSQMRLQAFMTVGEISADESVCSADLSSSTTAPPSPLPTSPLPPPERGNYSVTNTNGSVCMLALMGLQINITHLSQNQSVSALVNLQPNRTTPTGSCGDSMSTLELSDEESRTNLSLSFSLNSTSRKFFLSAANVSALWPGMSDVFESGSGSLSLLQGSLGRSYMCSTQQSLQVTPVFTINTFNLQIQPFGVSGNQFSTAEECLLDKENLLVPIVVGAALAGLVLIVLIAYLIGRKRTHPGYQTI
ncbi:hypothetical protein DNTS_024820 [Danionella cerebrum]|uniref:Lysosomal-associated membrane protein 1 n=1 Tax=Danionella cerebrum TaxID=2873325 RepID=A0A553QRY3_9TELE|nr:hypothetical protein DNTS_024820 [Danionella translucida]